MILDRRTLLTGAIAGAAAMPLPGLAQTGSDGDYARLLARYVRASLDGINRVAYRRWAASTADRAALNAVVERLASQRPSTLNRDQRFCFWVNLYNAVTLKVVVDAFPVTTIRNIGVPGLGPWRQRRVTVEGRGLSLDDIEHRILRPQFGEPRVHYAVNCASVGCPNLKATPWVAATLEADLTAGARAFVASTRGVRVIRPGQVRVSSIYQWFKADFGGNDAGVLAHLSTYTTPALRSALAGARITGHDYDWSINDA